MHACKGLGIQTWVMIRDPVVSIFQTFYLWIKYVLGLEPTPSPSLMIGVMAFVATLAMGSSRCSLVMKICHELETVPTFPVTFVYFCRVDSRMKISIIRAVGNIRWNSIEQLTVPSARLTLHSSKLGTKFKISRRKIFFVTKVTSETFLSIFQNLKPTRLQGCTQTKH